LARIRALKLGFFQNEALAEWSFAHRLLFEGLWVLADREGRLEDRPRRIKAQLFPYDAVDVSQMLQDLASGSDPFIRRYVVDGQGYLLVRQFGKHQRPAKSEAPSILPEPPECDELLSKSSETTSFVAPTDLFVAPTENSVGKGKGNGNGDREGERGEGESGALTRVPPAPDDLAAIWNAEAASPLPRCLHLSDKRRTAAKARLRDRPLAVWRAVVARISASRFCLGDNDRAWVATFDWLLQPDTALKVLEGKYDDRVPSARGHPGSKTGATVTAAAASLKKRLARLEEDEGYGVAIESGS
jgi:hypothetical protein